MKYKQERKVREHHKNLRKASRKNPTGRKTLKPLGVPSMHPLKEKLMDQYAKRKSANAAMVEAQKERRLQERQARRLAGAQGEQDALRDMVLKARRDASQFEETQQLAIQAAAAQAIAGGVFNDASRRAYFREFKKLVDGSDVILQVLDARDPLGCRSEAVESRILSAGRGEKRIVFVLNKIDLVPPENVQAWLKYLRRFHPCVAFKSSTQQQKNMRAQSSVPVNQASASHLRGAECLGADVLMQLLKNYARNRKVKKSIVVGIIGYPNVGKSSLINSLKRERAVGVGATPGFTKQTQEVKLDANITLMDCPGIVFATGDADEIALRNCVRVEQIVDPISPISAILRRCPPAQLRSFYGIPAFNGVTDFLVLIAQRRGKLKSGGVPHLEDAARTILEDWNNGVLKYYTTPPKTKARGMAIVNDFSVEFDIDALVAQEEAETLNKLDGSAANDAFVVDRSIVDAIDYEDEQDSIEEDESDDVEADDGMLTTTAGDAYLRGSASKKMHEALARTTGGINSKKGRRSTQNAILEDLDAPFSFVEDFYAGDEDDDIDEDESSDEDDDVSI